MKHILKNIFLLLSLLSVNVYAIVGTSKGSADVSQGRFTYDIQILTPKGVSGLKPSLSLNYNSSNNGNSILGLGFSLAGLSSISKCNENLFTEKSDTSRASNYCLDGQKLLGVDSNIVYGETNSEYKTQINNQSKIIKKANSWLVYQKDGLIYEYGNTTDSNDNNVFYKVNKIKDRYNNEINFIYASSNNEQYIKQILYSNNSIDFIYEDRNDKKVLASRGVLGNINKRIKEISLKTVGMEVSSYKMTYEYRDNKSRIVSLEECVLGECLEPVEFEWEISEDNKTKESKLWLPSGNGQHPNNYLIATNSTGTYDMFMDMNGDGLPDRVSHHNYKTNTGGIHVALNTGRQSKIQKITNNKDQRIEINYSTLRDKDIYTASSTANYPSLDIKASSQELVKSLIIYDSLGGKNTTTFKYEGMKIHREYGSLGFEKIETYNDVSNTKTLSSYYQIFPKIGVAKSSSTYLNNIKISQSSSTIEVLKYYDNQDILNFEVKQSVQDKYDINGDFLLQSFVINSNFDEFGNIKTIQSTSKKGNIQYSKITQSMYSNNEDKWILSRLSAAKVTHLHEDGSSIVKTSAFLYNSDTGVLEAEIIEPNSTNSLTTTYVYDDFGNKISQSISASNIKSNTTKYLYDNNAKNIIKISNALGHNKNFVYDKSNRLIKVTNANGNTIEYTYDVMGRKIREERSDGTNRTWTYVWDDSVNNSMYKVIDKSTGSPEIITYFNILNQKVRVTKIGFDGSKIYEDTFYDNKAQIIKSSTPYYEIDKPSYIYKTYDALGRIIKLEKPGANGGTAIQTYKYTAFDIITSNAKGQVKTIKNNILGKQVRVEENASFIEYSYDAFGNLVKTLDAKGNEILLSYDIYGNKISMNDPDMGIWSYEYNALGKLVKQTDAKNQITEMKYDVLGRLIEKKESEGTTTWTYDRNNKGVGKLSYVNNDAYRKEYYYDAFGRLSNTKEYIDQNVFATSFSYNQNGKLEKTTRPDGFVSVNEYNDLGYLSAVKSPKTPFENQSQEQKEEILNAIQANLDSSLSYASQAVNYSNNAQKKKAKANLFLSLANDANNTGLKEQLLATASLSSQAAILLKAASNDAQDEAIKALKRVNYFLKQAQKSKIDNFYEFVSNAFRIQTRFYIDLAYTNLNQAIGSLDTLLNDQSIEGAKLVEQKALVQSNIEQTELLLSQALGLSQKVKNYKIMHEASILKAQEAGSSTYLDMVEDEKYTYYYKVLAADEFGRVTKDIVGNGLITKKEYDNTNGHLKYITTGYNGEGDVRDIVYSYDDLNNVISTQDNKQNIQSNYTYDNLNRLSTANIQKSNESINLTYVYDVLGNITNKSDVGAYTYTNAHQVQSAGSNTYSYDANGNVIQKNGITLEYSSFNKPILIQDLNNKTEFFYAPSRARYKKVLNNDVTYYSGKLFEKEITAGVIKYKNFIYAGNELVAINIEEDEGSLLIPSVRYLHKDNLGSIDTITNEAGEIVQRLAYKPFGERLIGSVLNQSSENKAVTKRGFTGHEHINEFNLIHMNGRVYDPIIGRFLSADPNIQAQYDTQSYNRYSYVKNNPLKYTDPSGFFFKSFFKKVRKVFKRAVKKIKKYAKVIVAVVVAAVIIYFTAGAASAWVATWGSSFATTTSIYGVGTVTASFTALGSMAAGAITGAAAGFASGLILSGTLKGALTGAATGAISGGVGGYFKAATMTRVLSKSVAGGVNSEINGGKFQQGFKTGLLTASASYLYGKVSARYNTNNGKAHFFQEGKSDVGEQLSPPRGLSGMLAQQNDVVTFFSSSDKSGIMKFFGKWLPFGDAFAEAHDGLFGNAPYELDFNTFTNVPTMFIAYPLTVAAWSDQHTISLDVYRNRKKY